MRYDDLSKCRQRTQGEVRAWRNSGKHEDTLWMQDFLRRAGLSVVSARDLTPVRMPVRPESYCLLFPVDQPETDLVREGDYVVLHVLPDGHFRVNTLTSDEFEARYELAD